MHSNSTDSTHATPEIPGERDLHFPACSLDACLHRALYFVRELTEISHIFTTAIVVVFIFWNPNAKITKICEISVSCFKICKALMQKSAEAAGGEMQVSFPGYFGGCVGAVCAVPVYALAL